MTRVDLARLVLESLRVRGWRLATAESCTGGLLGAAITSVPGSSAAYIGGWVTYANEAKMHELGVPAELLGPGGPGAVSAEVAEAMARGGRAASGADVCISVTGVAGPDGGTAQKPVGTVWLGLAMGDLVATRRLQLSGDREAVRAGAVEGALIWLEEALR